MASKGFIRDFAAALLLVALVFLAFGGALDCGFVRFDDHGYVTENPMVLAGLTKAGIHWAFTTNHMFYWHPLTWLSHMADVELYGLEPAGHHLTSLLLHALNALLLFFALRGTTKQFLPALLVAALWAVHPLRVESVVWITERKDELSTCFGLLALGAYGWRALRGRMVWTAVFFALALMSKPMWVTLPLLLLLVDVWPLQRWPETSAWKLVREKVPLFLLAGVFCGITYFVQQAGGAVQSSVYYPFGVRVENAVVAYVQYIRALFWPVHLSAFYPHPGASLAAGRVWGALGILVLLTAWAGADARRRPWGLLGWLWFLGALVPMIGLVQTGGQAWADRYSYLPHMGLVVALVWGGREMAAAVFRQPWAVPHDRGLRIGLAVVAGTIVLALALLSRQQTLVWHDSETLFRHALDVQENNATMRLNLANWYLQQGRMDETIQQYRILVADFPRHAEALNNLAWLLATDLRCTPAQAEEALGYANRAIALTKNPTPAMLDTLALARARSRGSAKSP